ncbi:MAG TPA: ribonuclease III [Bryobacteraceae bacterium]
MVEARLGYVFCDATLLARALTHKSHVHERPGALIALDSRAPEMAPRDNEQLEFLGDSILGFLVSESLVQRFPDSPEGRLSKVKAHLVSEERLHEVAKELDLGEFLVLGRGEEMSGGRGKRALLADAVEALIAALYLDGGLDVVRNFIESNIVVPFFANGGGVDAALTDFKSALQETAQALKLPAPRYVVIGETGPEHSKTFTVEVRLGKDWSSQASGHSKKAAGQRAAQQVLGKLAANGEASEAAE